VNDFLAILFYSPLLMLALGLGIAIGQSIMGVS